MVGEHPELLRSTGALFGAARRDRADVVELLLDLGTPIDLENGEKERALHIAAYQNAVRVAELLIARGAEIDPVETSWGNTPIDGAIYAQHPAMIELLGRYSSDVWCLVFVAQIDRLRDVLREHPDAARASWRGWTLLMRLPGDEGRATEVATLLIEHGAHAAAKNEQGETAADLAAKRGMDSVAALLRNAEVPAT